MTAAAAVIAGGRISGCACGRRRRAWPPRSFSRGPASYSAPGMREIGGGGESNPAAAPSPHRPRTRGAGGGGKPGGRRYSRRRLSEPAGTPAVLPARPVSLPVWPEASPQTCDQGHEQPSPVSAGARYSEQGPQKAPAKAERSRGTPLGRPRQLWRGGGELARAWRVMPAALRARPQASPGGGRLGACWAGGLCAWPCGRVARCSARDCCWPSEVVRFTRENVRPVLSWLNSNS